MASPFPIKKPGWIDEFQAFIMRGNVVDLAVGIIIGVAFTAIVASLVEDLVNPIIGLRIGGIDFSNLFVVISGERRPSLDATRQGGAAVLAIGKFINAVIKFVIDPFLDDLLDVPEIIDHTPRVEFLGFETDHDLAIVAVRVRALAVVVHEPVAVAKPDFLRDAVHRVSFRWSG